MAVKYHWELEVYQLAREGRQRIFKLSKGFPNVYKHYDGIIGKLVFMQTKPEPWLIRR